MLRCPKCNTTRAYKVYLLIPEEGNKREEMYRSRCCGEDIIVLKIYRMDGNVLIKRVKNTEGFKKRCIVDYEYKPGMTWRKAKGFFYFEGSRARNGEKGKRKRYSDDKQEGALISPVQ